jgi:hypothetical protein
MVAPRGRVKLQTYRETPRFSAVHSIVTGNVAELDPELKAINWAGRIPRKKRATPNVLKTLIAA